ncbi:TMA7-domain-containing protein [Obba rivulosa]|uniref:TMA7-domain-containing protein n=1 Tax=Obba rivulosa TaxID=1052685 RepID=A0A8E2J5V2_9APHY|nr:TMA7-domain-containing protein [Obba rivulosa]
MASRQGGKLKPLKAPKKDKKEMDEDEAAFKEKKRQEEAALKAARDKAAKGGPPGGGIKKYVRQEVNRPEHSRRPTLNPLSTHRTSHAATSGSEIRRVVNLHFCWWNIP